MTIRLKILVLMLCSLLVIAVGISLAAGMTSLRLADDQFSTNAEAQLDRVEELINSFLRTGEQVALALSKSPEANLPPGSLTDYTRTTDSTKLDPDKFSPTEAAMFRRLDGARSLMPSVEIALFGMEDGGFRDDKIYHFITGGCRDAAILQMSQEDHDETISVFADYAAAKKEIY